MPDEVAADIFHSLSERVSAACADSCLASPKEFWTYFSLQLTTLTNLHFASAAFDGMNADAECVCVCVQS
jgi:hypothetical protein